MKRRIIPPKEKQEKVNKDQRTDHCTEVNAGDSEDWTLSTCSRLPVQLSEDSDRKPDFQPYKGRGKNGNLGVAVKAVENAPAATQPPNPPPIPQPLPGLTQEEKDMQWKDGTFRKPPERFWNGETTWHIGKQTPVLWRNVAKGKKGGASTRVELIAGVCQGWASDDRIWFSRDAQQEPSAVHISCIEGDKWNEYCIAGGGRCYKIADVMQAQDASVKCPVCWNFFKTEWAYQAHYQSVHQTCQGEA